MHDDIRASSVKYYKIEQIFGAGKVSKELCDKQQLQKDVWSKQVDPRP